MDHLVLSTNNKVDLGKQSAGSNKHQWRRVASLILIRFARAEEEGQRGAALDVHHIARAPHAIVDIPQHDQPAGTQQCDPFRLVVNRCGQDWERRDAIVAASDEVCPRLLSQIPNLNMPVQSHGHHDAVRRSS